MLQPYLMPAGCWWEYENDAHWWALHVPTVWNYTRNRYDSVRVIFVADEELRDIHEDLTPLLIQEACARAIAVLERL